MINREKNHALCNTLSYTLIYLKLAYVIQINIFQYLTAKFDKCITYLKTLFQQLPGKALCITGKVLKFFAKPCM